MSADTAYGYCRNRIKIWMRLCNRSGPVKSELFKEWPLNLAAPFNTRRTLPGLCGLTRSRVMLCFKIIMMSVMVCKKCECHPPSGINTRIHPERDTLHFDQLILIHSYRLQT